MLKFNRKHKKLVIPVGINPSYNIDSSTLYNISDATANANDIISGKVAYGSDGKVIGTLVIDDLIEESYSEGVNEQKSKLTTITITENGTYNREDGYNEVIVEVPDINGSYDEGYNDGVQSQKSKLESITITENGTYNREDGYNEVIVEVPDLNGNYDEGYSEGVAVGREEIITEQSDATITPQTVLKGEIGYGSNNERIVGVMEAPNFTMIGYSQTESNNVNEIISNDIAYSKQLLEEWNSGNRNNFRSLSGMKYMPYVDTITVTDMEQFASDNSNLSYVPMLNTSNVTDMYRMFGNCTSLTTVPLFDTSKVTDMRYMFNNCSKLTSVPLFDTNSVIYMNSMFNNCSSLTSVPLFNTSKVTDMVGMFQSCSSLTTIPLFDTSKVNGMQNMFYYCSKLTSVPLFDTNSVTNMSYMFYYCSSLTSVPLFNTSNVTNMQNMFYSCSKLTTAPLFDTSNVTIVQNMFYNTSVTECPAYNTSNVTNADGFLNGCKQLVTINLLDFSKVNNTGGLGVYNTLNGLNELINVAGFINFGQGFTGSTANGFTLTSSTKLTVESCLNIFNNLYDMNLNTTYKGTPTIQLSSTTKALLSPEDIAIATSKGWTIS